MRNSYCTACDDYGHAADSHVTAMNAEWQVIQQHVRSGDEHDWEKAVRWALVQVFGSEQEYLMDPDFHYKVSVAEQLIWRLQDLRNQA